MTQNRKLIFTGGFLGAGKTTLLAAAATRLVAKGHRVGLVTNDQVSGLVDTILLVRNEAEVAEVSGSCFCCNYWGMVQAITSLEADVILAEPVGSCTDLAATIIEPLRARTGLEADVAPLSVLVDPSRVASDMHSASEYIYLKQLEEADYILITKCDTLSAEKIAALREQYQSRYPEARIFVTSAKTGEGLDEWLEVVLKESSSGGRIVPVDYDIYAEGEAVLGWLNATYDLASSQDTDWTATAQGFLETVVAGCVAKNAPIGHIKLAMEKDGDLLVANVTASDASPELRGEISGSKSARLTFNARAQMSPDDLDALVGESIQKVCGDNITATLIEKKCISPGRPTPTFRVQPES